MTNCYSLDGITPKGPVDGEFWVAPTALLIGNIHLGHESSVWFGVVIRADDDIVTIGDRSNVQDNSVLHVDPGFPLTVGVDCTIGHKVMLHGCSIGDNSLIGMNSVVLNGARIGRNCLIGANCLITENKVIPDNSLVMGAPGKVVRQIDEAGVRNLGEGAALYVRRWRRYAKAFAPAKEM